MDLIWDGITEAFDLLISGDAYVYEIMFFSLFVSGAATAIAAVVGLTVSSFLAFRSAPGGAVVVGAFNIGVALPPVVVGLIVAIMLWRTGPLGQLHLLYTPAAIIIAQSILATPIFIAISVAGLQSLPQRLRLQILALGASRMQAALLLFREARLSILAAVIAAFGAAISEVGATIMVGGNIKGETRTLTSAVVLETQQGDFETAIALSFILMGLVLFVVSTFTFIQQRRPTS
jgi:tungstate transport system permease protein